MRSYKAIIIIASLLVVITLIFNYLTPKASTISFENFILLNTREAEGLGYPKKYEHYFLIDGYTKLDLSINKIDSFVCSLHGNTIYLEQNPSEKIRYFFFRKSKKTNSEHLKIFPEDFFRYSIKHDYICQYEFDYSGKGRIFYYKDGLFDKLISNFNCK